MPQQKNPEYRAQRGENVERTANFSTTAVLATTGYEHTIFSDDRADTSAEGGEITSVEWEPDATVTGQATNFATITVVQYDKNGVLKATVGTLAFSSAAVTAPANQRKSLLTAPTSAPIPFAVGDYFDFKVVQTGTGLALPAGSGTVRFSEY